jgi:MFS family permease
MLLSSRSWSIKESIGKNVHGRSWITRSLYALSRNYGEFSLDLHEDRLLIPVSLNFMFTVAAVATNVSALPIGAILDKYGPRVCGIMGSIFVATGCLFLGFASRAPFDAWIAGYFFLALGGPFVFIPSFQLSNTFPANSGLILSMLTGAFDSSSVIFLLYQIIYNSSGQTFAPGKFFLCYLVVPVFIFLVQIFLMPATSYKTVGELVRQIEEDTGTPEDIEHNLAFSTADPTRRASLIEEHRIRRESVVSEITSLLGTKGGERHAKKEEKKMDVSGVWGALHGRTAFQQIKTPWFWLITVFTVVQMTRINFFVATIRPQYEYLLHSFKAAVRINTFFDVALPLGGLVAVPFIGVILDNTSTPFVLGLLVSLATVIGVLGTLQHTWAAYANVTLFVIYRPLYYTTVSDYSAKVFGFQTFGKVYGLIICLAGLFNFTQSGLDAITHRVFDNDPIPVNIMLLCLAFCVGSALVGFVWFESRSMKRHMLEDEAEGATERLMPEAIREDVTAEEELDEP